ncbi:MAG TPA: alpha-ketoacid dehydrogenase subunit beta [Bacteroidota bacterium]|nr:alpha-ketoacid dehydrogenase subunit beta [Bacteroidota bacterium]
MGRTVTYIDAISEGLREEMRRDKTVFVLGEDVGAYGGAFKVTKGLIEEFGEDRVIDTVIAEAGIVGAAMGSAIAGLRPVAEMQFADFVSNAFNQIVTNVSKFYWRTGIPLPMVVRLPSGGGLSGGPYHSVSPEGWFFHSPGLKIVAPSTPYDAKGLMKSAIRDPNPVLYLESKYLYRHVKAEIPEDDFTVPIGEAEIKRAGSDISVVTYGTGVHWALEAAETISKEGVEVEVIDMRTLLPFDERTMIDSVKKTGKVLILHEDTLTGGVGAEFAAVIADRAFQFLDAPIRRLAAHDTPVPFAPTLEKFFLPNAQKTLDALRELAAY